MKLFTVGFTQKSAEKFFTTLKTPGVKRVVDIRLNNVSQLAGFTKKDDLKYFLQEILGLDYLHVLEFAPSEEILNKYKKHDGDWKAFEAEFTQLMADRKAETVLAKKVLDGACLLCSEATPEHCHRRFLAEYLQRKLGDIEIVHL